LRRPTEPAGGQRYAAAVTATVVGYARCSTDRQDLTAQWDALTALGVAADRVYVDHGLTGTDRKRPGLREAMAACHEGSTLVVTKLDRLARSVRDAGDIAEELTRKEVKLSIGGSVHDPTDPFGKWLFNALAIIAEFSVIWTRRDARLPPNTTSRKRSAVNQAPQG
jgi:DNA invertase Pin-like site-specific DNA recombinase